MTGAELQRRCAGWHRAKFPGRDVSWMIAKLTEEVGELARAIIGQHERRPNRGDPVLEAAQAVLVLLTIIGEHYPDADLMREVEYELLRHEHLLESQP